MSSHLPHRPDNPDNDFTLAHYREILARITETHENATPEKPASIEW